MANNGEFIELTSGETLKQIKEIVSLINQGADGVVRLNAEFAKVKTPSGNKNVLAGVNSELANSEKIRLAEIKLEQAREKAFDRYSSQLAKKEALETKATNKAINDSEKLIKQKEKEYQKFNKLSSEEIVNNRYLRQNSEQYARSVSVLGGAYQRLSAQQAIASKRVQDIISRGRTAEQTQRQYNRELRTAQKEFDALNKRVLAADRAVGRFNRNVGNYPKQAIGGIRDLMGAFGIIGGVTAIAAITKNVFNTTRALQSMDLALRQVMGSSEDAAQSQAFLSRISEQYGIELMGLTSSYTAFYAASKNAIDSGAISAQQINDIFESVSKASGAMGLSVDQQKGAFLALQQMISKGTVQAEEIRGQLAERLPGAFGILAKSMGVTEQQLNKLLKDGKVLAAEVLPKFAKELEKAYGVENLNRVESLNAETSRLSNTWTEFIRELNSGNGVVPTFFANIIKGINGALGGFKLLIQTRDSLLKGLNDKGFSKGYDDQKAALLEIENIEQRRFNALAAREDQFSLMTKTMKELNKLTEKQKELESKGMGEDPIEKLFGKESEFDKNAKKIEELNYQIGIRQGKLKAISAVLDELNPKEKADTEEKAKKIKIKKESNILDDLTAQKSRTLIGLIEDEIKRTEILRDTVSKNSSEYEIFQKRIRDLEYSLQALTDVQGLMAEGADKAMESLKKEGEEIEAVQLRLLELQTATNSFLRGVGSSFFSSLGLDSINFFTEITESGATAFDTLMAGAETTTQKIAILMKGFGDLAIQAIEFLNQNQQAYFDNQYARLEKEKDLALEFAGESDSAKAEIERQYEARQRAIRRREARAEKDMNLFKAIINTAQAVTAALPNVALAALAGILGAAQIALISSTQIPEYALGTDNHAGGLAIVGDGGKREVVYQPSSGFSITPKTDTLVDLEKGSKVYPDFNSFLKNSGAMLGGVPNIQLESSGASASEIDSIMGKYFSNITTNNFTFDKNGFNASIAKRNSRINLMNNSVKGKGFSV